MSPSLIALGTDRLTIEERLQLLEDLWDDVAAHVDANDVPPSHRAELDRRLADHQANPHPGFTWEEVRERLRRRKAGEVL